MLKLVLYETSHCHLCEQVQEMLVPYVERGICVVELVDIAEDDRLLSEYAQRIPVLVNLTGGSELPWPFDHAQLDAWLRQQTRQRIEE